VIDVMNLESYYN